MPHIIILLGLLTILLYSFTKLVFGLLFSTKIIQRTFVTVTQQRTMELDLDILDIITCNNNIIKKT